MAIIEKEQTTVEEVKRTETSRRIQCDVCDDSWPEDSDIIIHELTVNKSKTEEFASIHELGRALNAYYVKIPVEEVREQDGDISVPEVQLYKAIFAEMEMVDTPASPHVMNVTNKSEHTEEEREELAELIGDDTFYLKDGFLHHMMYRLSAEWKSEETRHVCDDCYKIVF